MATRRFDGQFISVDGTRHPLFDSQHLTTGPSNGQVLASLGLSATIEGTVAHEAELVSTIRAEDFYGTIEADVAATLTASLGITTEIAADHSEGLVSAVIPLGLNATITGEVYNPASMTASLGIGLTGPDDGTPMVMVRVAGSTTASLGLNFASEAFTASSVGSASVTASLKLDTGIQTGVLVNAATTASLGLGSVLEASNADRLPAVDVSLGLQSSISAVLGPPPFQVSAGGGAAAGPRTRTRFRPLGPRVKINERPEDLWVRDAEIIAPPPPRPRAAPPPQAPRAQARALPQDVPMLARPQTGPVSQQAPVTPGQAVNELLATLNELAIAAGLDPSVVTDLQSVDAIDVSDVFNDMR